jgi:hypothetical protein
MKKRPTWVAYFLSMLSLTLLAALPARAQTTPSPQPGQPDNPSGEAPPMVGEVPLPPPETGAAADAPPPAPIPPPPPIESAPPGEPAAPTLEERVGAVEGKVDGLDESLAGTRSIADRLNKIKVSGYIQGRFEERANSANGVNAAGRPVTTNQFLVRRGRLKTTYDGTNAEYMLQIDATGSGVVLKDAEATFVDTWSPFGFRLTLGQFKWPFGYEILQSSGDREMPERSLVIRTLFPGERDRGLRVTGKYDFLRFAVALVNGTGSQDATYPNNDSNTYKDLVGRIGGDFEWLVVGLSGYWGRTLATTIPAPRIVITGTDTNMDGTIAPGELTGTSMAVPATYRRFSVARFGADAQLYFDVPEVGGLAVKGEFILAKNGNLDAGANNPATMMPIPKECYDVTSIGWIVTVVQNVGDYFGAVVRIDSYDPNYSKALDAGCPTAMVTRGQGDRVTTLGGGLLIYGSANIKGTFTYEHLDEQSNPVKNDIFTAQLQARF